MMIKMRVGCREKHFFLFGYKTLDETIFISYPKMSEPIRGSVSPLGAGGGEASFST